MKDNIHQIDFLKAIAIILVIILHTIPHDWLVNSFAQFHIWNAVPIFIILMAFTTYISCTKVSKQYTKEYFIKKLKRLGIPLIIVFFITIIINIILKDKNYFGCMNLIGYMPRTGPR